ncbi:hypothetical protein PACTADRAFT_48614 [Pachysolen tannophilus NRRL Y-2460]|uniref:BCD1 alpha/beta domain-containing protein n=1 Tax=Pachysolen tannophilus NRRL Y-2460 TaxID=669874 RepID=A0A1E4TYG8_PACTA|nr:hypothetical protein PACTADRAFT_48614 [Pachysolen tannophilus NRRL Y-2460]
MVDPTSYKAKQELQDSDVNRDYNFLMGLGRKIDIGKADSGKTKPLLSYNNSYNNRKRTYSGRNNVDGVDHHFFGKNSMVKRGCFVKPLPKGMHRSNVNKTGFDKRKNCFNWTVEWILIDKGNQILQTFTSFRCNESLKLIEAFPGRKFEKIQDLKDSDDLDRNNQYYFFIRDYSTNDKTLFKLDGESVIADIVKNKTVLEFPTIYLSLDTTIDGYKILGDGEDHENETKSNNNSSSSSSSNSSNSSSSSSEESDTDDNVNNSEEDIDEGPTEESAK